MFKKIAFTLILLTLLTFPHLTLATGNLTTAAKALTDAGTAAGVTSQADLPTVIGTMINIALSLVGIIFLVLMVYAGYLWMTAQGEEEKVKTAQKIITTCIIGMVVVMSAYAITFLVTSYLTSGS